MPKKIFNCDGYCGECKAIHHVERKYDPEGIFTYVLARHNGADGKKCPHSGREPHEFVDAPEIEAKHGLLWANGEVLPVYEADRIARLNGRQYAEQIIHEIANSIAAEEKTNKE